MDKVNLFILLATLNAVSSNRSAIEQLVFDDEKDEKPHIDVARILVRMSELELLLKDTFHYAANLYDKKLRGL